MNLFFLLGIAQLQMPTVTVMPVCAKFRSTSVFESSDGAQTKTLDQTGTWCRSADGSEYEEARTADGGIRIQIRNVAKQRVWQVAPAQKTAIEVVSRVIPRTPFAFGSKVEGQETRIQGLDAVCVTPGGPDVQSGRNCVSRPHDLPILDEFTMRSSKGTMRVKRELYDIELGKTSAQSLFEIPDGYTVLRPGTAP